MNALIGNSVVIVLGVGEARGFDFLQRPMWLEGALDKNVIASDLILPEPTPSVCTEFVWETQKKEIRKLRSSQVAVRITCYSTDINGKQEKVGLVMLNLRTARAIQNSLIHHVEFKWHKMQHVPSAFKAFHPEICLQLTIRDKVSKPEMKQEAICPAVEEITSNASKETGIIPVYLEEGWILLSDKKEECEKYLLKFTFGTAFNMNLLLNKEQILNAQNEEYCLALAILGLEKNTKAFYRNLHEPVILNSKVVIKLMMNPNMLAEILNKLEIVHIYFYYGKNLLATANINLNEYLKDNVGNNFLNDEEQYYCFSLEENQKIPCVNDLKPYVSIQTTLEIHCGTSNTTIASSVNLGTVNSKAKIEQKVEKNTSEITIENNQTVEEKHIDPNKSSSSTNDSNDLNESDAQTVIEQTTNLSKIIEKKENIIGKCESWIDQNRSIIEPNNIEVKYNCDKDIFTSESDSNQTISEKKQTENFNLNEKDTPALYVPKNLNLSLKRLSQDLGNCNDEDIITITTPDGRKIMKTVNSLLMESVKACGDMYTHSSEEISINKEISASEDAAVQTTPRVYNVPQASSLLELFNLEQKKQRIIANFNCPRDDYRLYRLEVIFRSITWRQTFNHNGFQFKINHPKANNTLIIACDLKGIKNNKNNILLDDVYFNLFFISQDDNILHLTAMYPPKISVQNLEDQNIVEDFDLYTKLMLNQGTRECNYFAVPNSLWDPEEIICDVQIDMKIHTVGTTANLFKNQFDLEPVVLDDWFALKTLAELEQWKAKQEILFQDNLKKIQCEKLELLQAEWNVKRMELEIKLQSGLEKCRELAAELTATASKYRSKKKNVDKTEDMQMKVNKLIEEEMQQTIRRLENEKYELLKSIEQLKYERKELDCQIRLQNEVLEDMRKTTLSKEQTKLVFTELRNLEEKFNTALLEKAFFKDEWHKALKEAHALKSADQVLIQQKIKRDKEELNDYDLSMNDPQCQRTINEESEEEFTTSFEALQIADISPCIY